MMIRQHRASSGKRKQSMSGITSPVRPHLESFDKVFDGAIRSNILLVDTVVKYVIKTRGKKVRPILVMLSADICGSVNERTYRGAALVEILHSATLIHDDVIDEADTRRGLASINALWKNKVSILMGDYLLARGLLLCLEAEDFDFLKITSTAVKRMSEGEIFQIQKSRKLDTDESTYMRIIGDKTASLVSTSCEIGAASATTDPASHTSLRLYGEEVGLAFQIRDDLLDYVGRRSVTGKPTGLDLGDKKLTLPVIHAMANAPKKEGKEILGIIKNGGKRIGRKDIEKVISFSSDYGGLEYSELKARELAASAKTRLEPFPDSPGKTSLEQFADFVVERDR